MEYSVIIIGDDSEVISQIKHFFESFTNYYCLGVYSNNVLSAEKLIKLKPQLVFVEIPDQISENSFSFDTVREVYQYMDIVPYFIGVSRSGSYALEAIQAGYSDYLIDPLDWHTMGKCLFKFEKRVVKAVNNSICIKSYSDYQFVNLNEIVYLKADNSSTDFKLRNGRVLTAYKTLKHFEENLPFYFLRIHKSYMVNINHVSRVHFGKGKCYLDYNEVLPFSASYRSNIEQIVQKSDSR